MNDQFNDEIQELEPLEELEGAFESQESILTTDIVTTSIRSYSQAPFPCCLLDSTLRLIWKNEAFDRHFPEVLEETSNLVTYFQGSFEGERKRALFSSLRAPESGYAWQGEVEIMERNRPKIIANLLVAPIFPQEPVGEGLPEAYIGIIDDISVHHRELMKTTFSSLLEASLLKDNDTGHHVLRVNGYSRVLAERIEKESLHEEVDFEFIETISFVAAMHDVGKIGTPDDILNKNGPLEDWEWEVMREHTKNGAYILSTYPAPMAGQIALFHHEWWNGTGYPYKLAADMIPLSARIVALADVYDALRMKRAYKDALTHEQACSEIEKGMNDHFDPKLASLFLEEHKAMKEVYEELVDSAS